MFHSAQHQWILITMAVWKWTLTMYSWIWMKPFLNIMILELIHVHQFCKKNRVLKASFLCWYYLFPGCNYTSVSIIVEGFYLWCADLDCFMVFWPSQNFKKKIQNFKKIRFSCDVNHIKEFLPLLLSRN